MLARLQQILNLIGLTLSVAAVLYGWNHSMWIAGLGLFGFWLFYVLFLALEFVLVQWLNGQDPVGRTSTWALARAWWLEALTAPQVFCWRQPFRSNAVPDYLPQNGQRGVVLLHGFVCNRGLWTPWMQALRSKGHAFVAVNLEPVFGSIDCYNAIVDEAVARVSQATGRAPVLVCHSMGGLAARAWLRSGDNLTRVHRVVTLGTPHHGTWLGQFSHLANGSQMRLNSDWLQRLAQAESAQTYQKFDCWFSNCDNVVFPASSATLPGANNQHIDGVAHVSLVTQPRIMQHTLAGLG